MTHLMRRPLLSWKIIPLVALTGFVLWLLWSRLVDLQAFRVALADADWQLAAVSVPLMAMAMIIACARQWFVLSAMGYSVRFLLILDAMLSVWPLSIVVPSRMNEFLKAVALREVVPVLEGSGAVLAERTVDVQTLCVVAALGSAVIAEWSFFASAATGAVVVWVSAVMLALAPEWFFKLPFVARFEPKLRRLFMAFSALRAHPVHLLAAIACSAGVWLVVIFIAFVLLTAFGAAVAFGDVLALWPLAVFAGLLPLTISGMGTRDAAFVALLVLSGRHVAEARVLVASMGYAFVVTLLPSLAGIPWMLRRMSTFTGALNDE